MHNTPPIFQQLLDSICPPADTLWRAAVKASDRRFTGERITAMCPLDDGIDEHDDDAVEPSQIEEDARTWNARNVG